jgi:hypothetical protein
MGIESQITQLAEDISELRGMLARVLHELGVKGSWHDPKLIGVRSNQDFLQNCQLLWDEDGPLPGYSRFNYQGKMKPGYVIKVVDQTLPGNQITSKLPGHEVMWCSDIQGREYEGKATLKRAQAGSDRMSLEHAGWFDVEIIGTAITQPPRLPTRGWTDSL